MHGGQHFFKAWWAANHLILAGHGSRHYDTQDRNAKRPRGMGASEESKIHALMPL